MEAARAARARDSQVAEEKGTSTREDSAHGLVGELEALVSAHKQSAEQAQTKAASDTAEAWARYRQSGKEIESTATKAWIDSYAAYLDAYQKLPAEPDDAALEAVRKAWAAHVRVCAGTPEAVKAWSAAEKTLLDALEDINSATANTLSAAGTSYSEGLRAALSAHGLINLDPAAVQLVTWQISAANAMMAGAS
jgi:hypothetical protein